MWTLQPLTKMHDSGENVWTRLYILDYILNLLEKVKFYISHSNVEKYRYIKQNYFENWIRLFQIFNFGVVLRKDIFRNISLSVFVIVIINIFHPFFWKAWFLSDSNSRVSHVNIIFWATNSLAISIIAFFQRIPVFLFSLLTNCFRFPTVFYACILL